MANNKLVKWRFINDMRTFIFGTKVSIHPHLKSYFDNVVGGFLPVTGCAFAESHSDEHGMHHLLIVDVD